GAVRDAVLDFVEQKIWALLCGFSRLKVLAPFRWNDAVASEFADSFSVGEFVRAHGIERFFREARGDGLGCLNERQRGGMRTKKGINRSGFWRARATGVNGAEELHELLSGAGGECVHGVRNDVCMLMFGKIETNGDTAWTGVFIVVWHAGNTAEVREPNSDAN